MKIFPLEATSRLCFNFIVCDISINMATLRRWNYINTCTSVLVYYPGISYGNKYLKKTPSSCAHFFVEFKNQ